MRRSTLPIFAFAALAILTLSFQNCGSSFEVQKLASSSSDGTSLSDNSGPSSNDQDSPLAINAPSGITTVGMNVTSKIDAQGPKAPSNSNFIVRVPPTSGKLTLSSNPSATSTIDFKPNPGFLGADSFTIAIVDANGQVGPDRKFDIRVEQKGIGQMYGTFQNSVCVPNTNPSTATYYSTETRFLYTEAAYSNDCTTPLYDLQISGTHSIGLENVSINGVNAFEYNILDHTTSLYVHNAQALNAVNFCGQSSWQNNMSYSLTLMGCNGYWAGRANYMYRRVEIVNGQTRLYISTQMNGLGTTPANRTQGLSTNYILKKRNDAGVIEPIP